MMRIAPKQKYLCSLKSMLRILSAPKKRIVTPLPWERGGGEAFPHPILKSKNRIPSFPNLRSIKSFLRILCALKKHIVAPLPRERGWGEAFLLLISLQTTAQDTVHYTGKTLSNVDYHHGQLAPAIGVHNIQVLRANRENPETADGFGWTYNHAPMIAWWNKTFFLEYLSDPVGEHVPPGQTFLLTSKDGYNWTKPTVIFPIYNVPDGFKKPGREGVAKNLKAVMHQRMGFYVSANNKLLALAYYAIAMDEKDDPNDGNGIGRVVREIFPDGSFGPIYFIRFNHLFNEKNTSYPFYKKSKDKSFIAACDELLSKPLMMQHWNEEADRDDPIIPLKKQYKAFSFYTLPGGKTVGLWKHALTSMSSDGGKSWAYPPLRAPGFVNSNAKIWGQKTSDNRFVTVYNPSEYRWPLALSTSNNGIEYRDLLLVNGEVSPMRYGGNYKSYGPQYVRGILEGNGTPSDGKLWVTYSMNKEDIWVASVPVPITGENTTHLSVNFSGDKEKKTLDRWNLYSPLWAPVLLEKDALTLKDKDPYDYAKAEVVLPASPVFETEFVLETKQNDHGHLDIELLDAKGTAAFRLSFTKEGNITAKAGARYRTIQKYEPGTKYTIRLKLNAATRMCSVSVNGVDKGPHILFAPIHAVERVSFRTGEVRRFPDADTPADNNADLPGAGTPVKEAVFHLYKIETRG